MPRPVWVRPCLAGLLAAAVSLFFLDSSLAQVRKKDLNWVKPPAAPRPVLEPEVSPKPGQRVVQVQVWYCHYCGAEVGTGPDWPRGNCPGCRRRLQLFTTGTRSQLVNAAEEERSASEVIERAVSEVGVWVISVAGLTLVGLILVLPRWRRASATGERKSPAQLLPGMAGSTVQPPDCDSEAIVAEEPVSGPIDPALAGPVNWSSLTEQERPPSFFHGRATHAFRRNRFYRIYLRAGELLFIQAGPGSADAIAMQAAIQGGALGGLIGGLIAGKMKKKTEERQKELDQATWQELDEIIAQDKHSFRLCTADISDVCIEPRSFWHSALYNPHHAALLRIWHRDRGKLTIELPTPEDVRIAMENLPSVLNGELAVNLAWDERRQRYVHR